ncbi:MAG TPA: Mut7-C RNAse domain-containing protein [Burkholderiaceae bacterium]|jgi:hypothetical protein|nr:Mut7-C RNAse domain-containing protein [Burkholderiaceae bacterium]
MPAVEFRFYEELNDFLPRERSKRSFHVDCAREANVKHAIEALGVPHTEVELVLVNGESVGFEHALRDGDRVSVYPQFEAFDMRPLLRVRTAPLRVTRFIADAHLGRLARYLRFLGYDTLYRNAWSDRELVALAVAEQRILLTRDRAALMHRALTHGCYLRDDEPLAQLAALAQRLELSADPARPGRCMLCNEPLRTIEKSTIVAQLLPATLAHHERFWQCPGCERIYWRGSHWQRLRRSVDAAVARREPARSAPSESSECC